MGKKGLRKRLGRIKLHTDYFPNVTEEIAVFEKKFEKHRAVYSFVFSAKTTGEVMDRLSEFISMKIYHNKGREFMLVQRLGSAHYIVE